ncbi:TPA: toxin Cry1Ac domain D-VI-related protein, partial [Enterococcus hirae]
MKTIKKKKKGKNYVRKVVSASTAGLILFSTVSSPVLSYAETILGEKKAASTQESNAGLKESLISELEKATNKIEEKTKTSEEIATAETTENSVKVAEANEAITAVRNLYEDEAQTIVKKDLLQATIDEAREKVNALPDGEEKTRLVEKIDQAYNGLQEIQLKGYYDRLFSRITVTNGKLLIRTEEGRPHQYIEDNYAEIDIRRGEQSVYRISYYGNEVYTQGTEEINIQDGDIVTVMKKEATKQRMIVNHPELKPSNDGNYTYIVQDGLLIEASRKIQMDAQNAVKGLYEDEAQTIVKKDLLQATIDEAREKVNALPDGEEKNALLAKVDEAYNGLQEFQLKGMSDFLFSRITVTKGKLVVRTQAGYPHYLWDGVYSSIKVTRNEESVYSREYDGKTNYPASQDEVNLQNGDIVNIIKREANQTRFIVNHPELKPNESENYTYVVQDGLLIEASRKLQLDAQNAVKGLYEDEAQTIVKKDLLQATIDEAREKVNALPDGEEKTRLLAKVDEAYNGLQEFQLKGMSDFLFSRITVTKGKLVVRTQAGYPHHRWDGVYSSIKVTRNEESVYSREYDGKTNYSASQDEVNLQNGDVVTIMKHEANQNLFVVNHAELKPNTSGNYTYVVQDGLLIEASDKVLKEAQAAVKGLYENEEQTIVKKDLLQATIDEAHEKVNVLPDSEEKTRLLAKVDQA